jgi:hypothetical protein
MPAEISAGNVTRGIAEMTRSAKTAPAPAPAGAAAESAPDAPPDARPSTSAAAPPAGPAAAIVAALLAAPGATAAQVAETAGITRAAAARELAALEKAGRATRDQEASPATWTALHSLDEAPRPDSPDSLAPSPGPSIAGGIAAPDTDTIGAGEPDPEQEDAGSAVPASPAVIAAGTGEALGAAGAAAAQAQAALRAGDLDGALAAADQLTQAAARTRRLLRDAGRSARRGPAAGTPPGELRGLVAAHLAAFPAQDFGPHAIGRVLGRSSGAVANALDRLTALGQAQLTSEAPRRYRYADPPAAQS